MRRGGYIEDRTMLLVQMHCGEFLIIKLEVLHFTAIETYKLTLTDSTKAFMLISKKHRNFIAIHINIL